MYSSVHRNTAAQNMGYDSRGRRITPAPGTFRKTGRGQLDKPAKPASPKQLDLLHKLMAELTELVTVPETPSHDESDLIRNTRIFTSLMADHVDELNIDSASSLIDASMREIRKARQANRAALQVTDGFYYFNDEVVKVQRAIHGSGQLYAKRLVVTDGSGTWEYAPGLVRQLAPEHKLTREQAAEFGRLYGICCICGATLTNETSIEAGIGPVCSSRIN